MASELMKVALKPTCSNSETKLIDGASGKTYVVLSISRRPLEKSTGEGTRHKH